jgi:hypothetical protein
VNWPLIVLYLLGVPVAAWIDLRVDPTPRYNDWGKKKSDADVGFEVSILAVAWPIVLPFALLYYILRAIGRLLGQSR